MSEAAKAEVGDGEGAVARTPRQPFPKSIEISQSLGELDWIPRPKFTRAAPSRD